LQKRSNPTGSYTPSQAACPATQNGNTGFIRSTQTNALSSNETDYIQRHKQSTQQAWSEWLSSSNPGPNLNGDLPGGAQNYTSDLSRLPRVGIALSGGGYRAMINGAGVLQGWDSRNDTAKQRGTAGILQFADYVAGLSGGSWAVGSFAINDWPTTQSLLLDTWDLPENLVVPQDGKVSFYADIVSDVAGKRLAGYPTGIVDYWGRALSYHLVNSTYPNEGQGTTFGDIRNTSNFQQASFPFPVVIADEREPGELLIYRNTTIFEFNPFEFGSYDPDVSAFVPIDILGTDLANGVSAEKNNQCTYGFDNFGWVVGTSSTLFNALFNMLITSNGDSLIKDALQAILGAISQDKNDVSVLPNPFRGYRENDPNVTVSSLQNITLVDGGEDNQNVPINTLLLPGRELDLILAVDNSADTTDWPNGTALHETFLRYKNNAQYNNIPMPIIPSPETFINRGLNTRPTFFGCNATAGNGAVPDVINIQSGANASLAPIIAYIPNYPYSSLSNTSTYQLQYDNSSAQMLIDNAVDVATMGGLTDSTTEIYWPTCLACAALERGFARSNTPRPSVCENCLQKYCWDGVTNDTQPTNVYSPAVGKPEFITSIGAVLVQPASTGGNGSNS
ncbi:putative lysophospholipase, partial [Meira miltonrushii]